MLHEATDWVLKHSKAKNSDRLVLVVLAYILNPYYRLAWPSVATISRLANLGESTVQAAKGRLVEAGELRIYNRLGPCGVDLYEIPALPRRGWPRFTDSGRLAEGPDSGPDSSVGPSSIDHQDSEKSPNVLGLDSGPSASTAQEEVRDLLLSKQIDQAQLRLSYWFADALIARGLKSSRYRDDAASDRWLDPISRILFERLRDLEIIVPAIEWALDETDWRICEPRDLFTSRLDEALGAVRAPEPLPAPRFARDRLPDAASNEGVESYGSGDFAQAIERYHRTTRPGA